MDSQEILTRFYKSMNRSSNHQDGKIHISSLCYDCLRRTYYSMKHDHQYFNLKTLVTFWIGRNIHLTPILKESEVPLEWDGIIGTCDEYEDGVLLEKKTCRKIPLHPNSQHVKQAEYYALMLEKAGKPVREAHVIYIDVATPDIAVKPIALRPFNVIESEMRAKADSLKSALNDNNPPDRFISWLCGYCPFASMCFDSK